MKYALNKDNINIRYFCMTLIENVKYLFNINLFYVFTLKKITAIIKLM